MIDAAWKNLDFTYDPLAETLRASADSAFKLGFLGAHRPNLSAIYDFRPLNAVLAALGVAPVQE